MAFRLTRCRAHGLRLACIVAGSAVACATLCQPTSAQCKKWTNSLVEADFGLTASSPEEQLQPARRMMYTLTYQEACQNFFDKAHPGHGPISYSAVTQNLYAVCTANTCNNGAGCPIATNVNYNQNVPRQPCCSIAVRGPHWDITKPPYQPTRDGTFGGSINVNPQTGKETLKGQKGAILKDHRKIYDLQVGELLKSEVPSIDYYQSLEFRPRTFVVDNESYYPPVLFEHPPTFHVYNPDAAQIDHIIPRVDINGCPCGTNEYSNAVVISARLNNEMKNYCDNPKRQQLIMGFPAPP